MPTIAIRRATLADVPAITAIYRPAVLYGTASFEIDPPDEAEIARRFTAISAAYPYLVAEVDGRVAGYAYVSAYRPRPAYRHTVEDSIYVAPDVQRLGIGRTLLADLITAAETAGHRQMLAVIGDSRQTPSITLHRNAGFQFCGTLHAVGFKHGRWLDGVIMQRALGIGDRKPPADTPL
jgi:L-amino acid N-acyltransferase YncA